MVSTNQRRTLVKEKCSYTKEVQAFFLLLSKQYVIKAIYIILKMYEVF